MPRVAALGTRRALRNLRALDRDDSGNIVARLVGAVHADRARARFAASIVRMQAVAPDGEAYIESSTEIIFRLHGLEFARAKLAPVAGWFRYDEVITFGLCPAEYALDDAHEPTFRDPVTRLAQRCSPSGGAAIRPSASVPSAGSDRE